jgi:hypothetical protein
MRIGMAATEGAALVDARAHEVRQIDSLDPVDIGRPEGVVFTCQPQKATVWDCSSAFLLG